MLVDLSKLLGKEQAEKRISCPPGFKSVTFGKETYAVRDGACAEIKVLHTLNGHFRVTGHAGLVLVMECARCLEPVDVPFELEIFAEFDTEKNDISEDLPYIHGCSLDTDLLVEDELFVNMPISVLCRPDCLGICPRCGINLNTGSCGCSKEEPDPRMLRLLEVFNAENKEV